MKNWKRILSLLLVLCMCFSLLPLSAFAEDGAEDEPVIEEIEDLPAPGTPEEDPEDEPCGHVPAEAVTENAVAPTCTEPGSRDVVVYCALCGAELSRETVEDPALGHTPEDVEAVAPTCTEPGHTAGVVCSRCGEILEGCELIETQEEASSIKKTASDDVRADMFVGNSDWSNGWEMWSQNQSSIEGMSGWGCWVVAKAKLLACSGIASRNPSVFNPDTLYYWELENGHLYGEDSGHYMVAINGETSPYDYAACAGKTLNYEGRVASSQEDVQNKIWENIQQGKYSILSSGSAVHWEFVNNAVSAQEGAIYTYGSWSGQITPNIPGTTMWDGPFVLVDTYSVPSSTPPQPVTYSVTEIIPAIDATCTEAGRKAAFKLDNGKMYIGSGYSVGDQLTAIQVAGLLEVSSYNALEIAPLGHGALFFVDTATCINSGLAYFECHICGRHFQDAAATVEGESYSPIKKHKPGPEIAAMVSTCIVQGNRAYSVCVNCGVYCDLEGNALTPSDICLPLAPHQPVLHAAIAPSCCQVGFAEYWQCAVCGKIFADADATQETTLDELTIPIDPNAHVWSDWETVQEPTETECGLKRRSCLLCERTETAVIPATGHIHDLVWVWPEDSTCIMHGHIFHRRCTSCGQLFSSASGVKVYNDGTREEVFSPLSEDEVRLPLDPDNHEALTHVPANAPDCVTSGNIEHWHCTACGKYYTDAAATTETHEPDITIPARGHSWGDWQVVKPVTDTCDGLQRRVCAECQAEELEGIPAAHREYYVVTEVWAAVAGDCWTKGRNAGFRLSNGKTYLGYPRVPAGDVLSAIEVLTLPEVETLETGYVHADLTEVVIPPSCIEGRHYWECNICGKHFKDAAATIDGENITPAADAHRWGPWTVVTPPTDVSYGVERRTCTVCGLEEERGIPAVGIIDGYPLYYVIPDRQEPFDLFNGENSITLCSDLIEELTAAGSGAEYIGVHIGQNSLFEYNFTAEAGYKAWSQYIVIDKSVLGGLPNGQYRLWIDDTRDPGVCSAEGALVGGRFTNSVVLYIDTDFSGRKTATLVPEEKDYFSINMPEDLRFLASEALDPATVTVDAVPLSAESFELSNYGLRLSLRASFLGSLYCGTHTVAAFTRRGIRVSCEVNGYYSAGARARHDPMRVTPDHDYLLLKPGDTAQLAPVGLDENWAKRLRWTASEDGTLPDDPNTPADLPISVSDTGLVTANYDGTAYAVAYFRGSSAAAGSCRVDVMANESGSLTPIADELTVNGVRLPVTKATSELYSTVYAELPVELVLGQNIEYAQSVNAEGDPAPGNTGKAIESARFVDPGAAAVFDLRVKDDRTLLVVPKDAFVNGDAAKLKTLKGSYKSAVAVTVEGREFKTPEKQPLTLTLKQSKPKVTAKAVRLNSFLPCDRQTLDFNGAGLSETALDNGKTQPDWLSYDELSRSVTYTGPLDIGKSGKLNLLVRPEGWAIRVPVAVSVSAAKSAPRLSFKPSSVNLHPGIGDYTSAELSMSPELFNDSETWPIGLVSVMEGRSAVPDALDITISGHSLYIREGIAAPSDGKAHSYKLTLALLRNGNATPVTATLTVKLLASGGRITLSAKAAGYIDTAIPESSATVQVTASGIGSGAAWIYPDSDVIVWREKKGAAPLDVTERFVLCSVGPSSFTLRQRTGAALESGNTYSAEIRKNFNGTVFSCRVKLPLRFSDPAKVKSSVTLKVTGAIDVIRPGSMVTVTPTVKNCFTYVPEAGDLHIYKQQGKDFIDVTDTAENPFAVHVENGVFLLSRTGGIDHKADKFKVSLKTTMDGRQVSSAQVAVTVKMGASKFAQNVKSVTLLKDDRYDRAVLRLTPEAGLSGIKRVSLVSPADKNKRTVFALTPLGNNEYAIGYNGNKLPDPGFKGGTVKLQVFLDGNLTATPNATLSVSVKLN